MNVKAAPGTRCPMEGKPRNHITDSETVTVPNTTYYRRLVDDGSLIEVTAPAVKTKPAKPTEGGEA